MPAEVSQAAWGEPRNVDVNLLPFVKRSVARPGLGNLSSEVRFKDRIETVQLILGDQPPNRIDLTLEKTRLRTPVLVEFMVLLLTDQANKLAEAQRSFWIDGIIDQIHEASCCLNLDGVMPSRRNKLVQVRAYHSLQWFADNGEAQVVGLG
jgi:hypothetical protein